MFLKFYPKHIFQIKVKKTKSSPFFFGITKTKYENIKIPKSENLEIENLKYYFKHTFLYLLTIFIILYICIHTHISEIELILVMKHCF